ncbi:aspartate/glutamate racemase family protein [Paraurantiacibacter namhicola]|uniref:Aspartate racemase n=1 Tax=Paraurantiacibacter namhicola TaxID=645517 RepID=A0A1C7D7Q7_9SPHN|nr:amino acid racemase [Paraurantiacibacter namhicola]ANU07519.1 Aspartate racemase [Paraurantiacibacter namhicola]
MRKLGIIGGMSWVSTRIYYDRINEIVQGKAGRNSSAPLVIESLDFAQLYRLQDDADWDRAADVLCEAARNCERSGAGALVIGANSMHRVYDRVAAAVGIPVIHIADCVGEAMAAKETSNAAILGTRNVMTESFFRRRLVNHGVDLMPPDMAIVEQLDHIIYDELIAGKASRDAERALKSIITVKQQEGAEAIVLACTELALVVDVDANVLPIFDSTEIHAAKAAQWILGETEVDRSGAAAR